MKKRAFFILIVLYSCSSSPDIYSLETLSDDIKSFNQEDQKKLVVWSNNYEKYKNLTDSVHGVPVVLVPSMTYDKILELIQEKELRTIISDSLKYVKIKSVDILMDTIIDNTEIWIVDYDYFRSNQSLLEIVDGRGFSRNFDLADKIMVSASTGLTVGDSYEVFGNKKQVIGIIRNNSHIHRNNRHLILYAL